MANQTDHEASRFFETPVGRRALLALGARGVAGLYAALSACSAIGALSLLTGCYRAPGTARDQLIFFSEEKEMEFGLGAYREVLRQAQVEVDRRPPRRELVPLRQAVVVFGDNSLRRDA